MHRLHPANLRAAWWAVRTARRTRRVLRSRGLDSALGPPPPPPLPVWAERGVRGALRRWHETCLVNAIVLQAWEAAHGQRRDLVIGITGPNGFNAHAWLHGDPVPTADDPGVDASILDRSRGKGWTTMPQDANGSGEARHAPGDGASTRFSELLRRPAPRYRRQGPRVS